MHKILARFIRRKVLSGWRQASLNASHTSSVVLREQRDEARRLRVHLNRLIHEADERLNRPLVGSSKFPKPLGTDWSARPDLWRGPLPNQGIATPARRAEVFTGVTLFHDCSVSEIALRQTRNTGENDLAPFGVSIDVFAFTGSFLSLSIDLPQDATKGLTKQHTIRVAAQIETERELSVMARLNIQHGPNTESVVRALDLSAASTMADFDLDHLPLNEGRIEKIWLDLILERPNMNQVTIRDLTFCRHHLADM